MNQSIPSLTIPPGKPLGNCLKGQIPHSPGHKESANSDPCGRKIVLKPHARAIFFKNLAKKNTKHEIEVMKNSTKILIRLEILKQ